MNKNFKTQELVLGSRNNKCNIIPRRCPKNGFILLNLETKYFSIFSVKSASIRSFITFIFSYPIYIYSKYRLFPMSVDLINKAFL